MIHSPIQQQHEETPKGEDNTKRNSTASTNGLATSPTPGKDDFGSLSDHNNGSRYENKHNNNNNNNRSRTSPPRSQSTAEAMCSAIAQQSTTGDTTSCVTQNGRTSSNVAEPISNSNRGGSHNIVAVLPLDIHESSNHDPGNNSNSVFQHPTPNKSGSYQQQQPLNNKNSSTSNPSKVHTQIVNMHSLLTPSSTDVSGTASSTQQQQQQTQTDSLLKKTHNSSLEYSRLRKQSGTDSLCISSVRRVEDDNNNNNNSDNKRPSVTNHNMLSLGESPSNLTSGGFLLSSTKKNNNNDTSDSTVKYPGSNTLTFQSIASEKNTVVNVAESQANTFPEEQQQQQLHNLGIHHHSNSGSRGGTGVYQSLQNSKSLQTSHHEKDNNNNNIHSSPHSHNQSPSPTDNNHNDENNNNNNNDPHRIPSREPSNLVSRGNENDNNKNSHNRKPSIQFVLAGENGEAKNEQVGSSNSHQEHNSNNVSKNQVVFGRSRPTGELNGSTSERYLPEHVHEQQRRFSSAGIQQQQQVFFSDNTDGNSGQPKSQGSRTGLPPLPLPSQVNNSGNSGANYYQLNASNNSRSPTSAQQPSVTFPAGSNNNTMNDSTTTSNSPMLNRQAGALRNNNNSSLQQQNSGNNFTPRTFFGNFAYSPNDIPFQQTSTCGSGFTTPGVEHLTRSQMPTKGSRRPSQFATTSASIMSGTPQPFYKLTPVLAIQFASAMEKRSDEEIFPSFSIFLNQQYAPVLTIQEGTKAPEKEQQQQDGKTEEKAKSDGDANKNKNDDDDDAEKLQKRRFDLNALYQQEMRIAGQLQLNAQLKLQKEQRDQKEREARQQEEQQQQLEPASPKKIRETADDLDNEVGGTTQRFEQRRDSESEEINQQRSMGSLAKTLDEEPLGNNNNNNVKSSQFTNTADDQSGVGHEAMISIASNASRSGAETNFSAKQHPSGSIDPSQIESMGGDKHAYVVISRKEDLTAPVVQTRTRRDTQLPMKKEDLCMDRDANEVTTSSSQNNNNQKNSSNDRTVDSSLNAGSGQSSFCNNNKQQGGQQQQQQNNTITTTSATTTSNIPMTPTAASYIFHEQNEMPADYLKPLFYEQGLLAVEDNTAKMYRVTRITGLVSSQILQNAIDVANLCLINHENIPHCVGCCYNARENELLIIFDYYPCSVVDQRTLTSITRAVNHTERQIQMYLRQILSALHTLHSRGIVHGNLVPGNIFVEPSSGLVKIGGFFAPACAREEVEAREAWGPKADMLMFGILIMQLVTQSGRSLLPHFEGECGLPGENRMLEQRKKRLMLQQFGSKSGLGLSVSLTKGGKGVGEASGNINPASQWHRGGSGRVPNDKSQTQAMFVDRDALFEASAKITSNPTNMRHENSSINNSVNPHHQPTVTENIASLTSSLQHNNNNEPDNEETAAPAPLQRRKKFVEEEEEQQQPQAPQHEKTEDFFAPPVVPPPPPLFDNTEQQQQEQQTETVSISSVARFLTKIDVAELTPLFGLLADNEAVHESCFFHVFSEFFRWEPDDLTLTAGFLLGQQQQQSGSNNHTTGSAAGNTSCKSPALSTSGKVHDKNNSNSNNMNKHSSNTVSEVNYDPSAVQLFTSCFNPAPIEDSDEDDDEEDEEDHDEEEEDDDIEAHELEEVPSFNQSPPAKSDNNNNNNPLVGNGSAEMAKNRQHTTAFEASDEQMKHQQHDESPPTSDAHQSRSSAAHEALTRQGTQRPSKMNSGSKKKAAQKGTLAARMHRPKNKFTIDGFEDVEDGQLCYEMSPDEIQNAEERRACLIPHFTVNSTEHGENSMSPQESNLGITATNNNILCVYNTSSGAVNNNANTGHTTSNSMRGGPAMANPMFNVFQPNEEHSNVNADTVNAGESERMMVGPGSNSGAVVFGGAAPPNYTNNSIAPGSASATRYNLDRESSGAADQKNLVSAGGVTQHYSSVAIPSSKHQQQAPSSSNPPSGAAAISSKAARPVESFSNNNNNSKKNATNEKREQEEPEDDDDENNNGALRLPYTNSSQNALAMDSSPSTTNTNSNIPNRANGSETHSLVIGLPSPKHQHQNNSTSSIPANRTSHSATNDVNNANNNKNDEDGHNSNNHVDLVAGSTSQHVVDHTRSSQRYNQTQDSNEDHNNNNNNNSRDNNNNVDLIIRVSNPSQQQHNHPHVGMAIGRNAYMNGSAHNPFTTSGGAVGTTNNNNNNTLKSINATFLFNNSTNAYPAGNLQGTIGNPAPLRHMESNLGGLGLRRGNYYNFDGTGGGGGGGVGTSFIGSTIGGGGGGGLKRRAKSFIDLVQLTVVTSGKLRVGELGVFRTHANVTILTAVDEVTNQQFIVKRCDIPYRQQRESVERLNMEVHLMKLASQVTNDTVRCYGSILRERSDLFVVILEYVQGVNLQQLRENLGDCLTEDQVRPIIQRCLAALSAIHYNALPGEEEGNGIAHLDIKPANIMLLPDGSVKLIDYGEARMLRNGNKPHRLERMLPTGTTAFMPPEMFDNQYSFKCDVWAMGCVTHYMLTGKLPFVSGDGNAYAAGKYVSSLKKGDPNFKPPIPPKVSMECARFIEACFTVDPYDRPTTADLLQHNWFHTGNALLQEQQQMAAANSGFVSRASMNALQQYGQGSAVAEFVVPFFPSSRRPSNVFPTSGAGLAFQEQAQVAAAIRQSMLQFNNTSNMSFVDGDNQQYHHRSNASVDATPMGSAQNPSLSPMARLLQNRMFVGARSPGSPGLLLSPNTLALKRQANRATPQNSSDNKSGVSNPQSFNSLGSNYRPANQQNSSLISGVGGGIGNSSVGSPSLGGANPSAVGTAPFSRIASAAALNNIEDQQQQQKRANEAAVVTRGGSGSNLNVVRDMSRLSSDSTDAKGDGGKTYNEAMLEMRQKQQEQERQEMLKRKQGLCGGLCC